MSNAGQAAYEGYIAFGLVKGSKEMPLAWDALPPRVREAWEVAAYACVLAQRLTEGRQS